MKIKSLGASSSNRWFNCPGSVRSCMVAPVIEGESGAADEGTAAHRLFELCLKKDVPAETYLDKKLKIERASVPSWPVDADMVDHIQAGVDLVKEKLGKGELWLENEIVIPTKPVPTRGTLDCGWYGKYDSEFQLHLLDLKYGYRNVEVSTTQLKIYAMAKLLHLQKLKKRVDSVHLWIYQPRSMHADGPFRHQKHSVSDFLKFGHELAAKVKAVCAPELTLHAGPWCLYCPAQSMCPEAEKAAWKTMRAKFREDDAVRIGELFLRIPYIKNWIKSIEEIAITMAMNGTMPEGTKLVDGRKSRSWPGGGKTDPEKQAQMDDMVPKLMKAFGLDIDDVAPRRLNSVAVVERKLDKSEKDDLEEYYHTSRGKEKLVPLDDTRYAITADLYFDKEE